MAPVIVPPRAVVPTRGVLRFGLFREMGEGWLRMDGATDYPRAAYPDFLTAAQAEPNSAAWLLAGSTSATFRLRKIGLGVAVTASGFDNDAGKLFGAEKATLTAENLPVHDHGYQDSQPVAKTATRGLLSGLLNIVSVSEVTAQDVKRTTDKAGSASPAPIATQSPSLSAHLFVYAGRPRSL